MQIEPSRIYQENEKRKERKIMFPRPVYKAIVQIVYSFYRATSKMELIGHSNIPAASPTIVIANHRSNYDALGPVLAVCRRGRYARAIAKISLWKNPLFAWFFNGVGLIPVKRNTADASKSLEAAIEQLQIGECIVVYPEGTRVHNADLSLGKFKTGAARLALAVPSIQVIPIGQLKVNGIYKLNIGKPLNIKGSETVEEVVEKMRAAIITLLNEIKE